MMGDSEGNRLEDMVSRATMSLCRYVSTKDNMILDSDLLSASKNWSIRQELSMKETTVFQYRRKDCP